MVLTFSPHTLLLCQIPIARKIIKQPTSHTSKILYFLIFINVIIFSSLVGDHWIGFDDIDNNGIYEWLNGKAIDQNNSNWNPGKSDVAY